MSLKKNTEFKTILKTRIENLENSIDFPQDESLKNIVNILKLVQTESDLKEQKGLICHIAIDSVNNSQTVNEIIEFLNLYWENILRCTTANSKQARFP